MHDDEAQASKDVPYLYFFVSNLVSCSSTLVVLLAPGRANHRRRDATRRDARARRYAAVVHLSRDDTVRGAMAKLARHGILAAPVVDEKNFQFYGFVSCLDMLHAFMGGIDPALTRRSYTERLTREQRMEELDAVAEEFLRTKLSCVRRGRCLFVLYSSHVVQASKRFRAVALLL